MPAWQLARIYLGGEYARDPVRFLDRLVHEAAQAARPWRGDDLLRVVAHVTGLLEPTEDEREFLCELTDRWVLDNTGSARAWLRFVADLSDQTFKS